jgi:hypothetical protein
VSTWNLVVLLCAASAIGCVRYVEPDDPPGTYASASAKHVLVLVADGTYELRSGSASSTGRWKLRPGCAMGLDWIDLEPAGHSEPIRISAGERWLGGLTLVMNGVVLERR